MQKLKDVLLVLIQGIAIPTLIFIYIFTLIPLSLRQLFHRITYFMDCLFDYVGKLAGFDTRYWPLPKAHREPLQKVGSE